MKKLDFLSQGQPQSLRGAWSPDGKYYYYEAGTAGHHDVWVVRDGGRPGSPAAKPVRLTWDSRNWSAPLPLTDRAVLAIGADEVGETVRLNTKTHEWQPLWDGRDAYELNYSRDAAWIVYTRSADHTIWKARADGTETVQVKIRGAREAFEPRWSPDATRIAVMAHKSNGEWKVMIVPATGGSGQEAPATNSGQGVPSWSANGQQIVFGERRSAKQEQITALHIWDLRTGQVSAIPGSRGLWTARWSPNGRLICAKTSDDTSLKLFSVRDRVWSGFITGIHSIDAIAWSSDSESLYFNGMRHLGPKKVYRVAIRGALLEELGDDVRGPSDNWFGVAPDGSPLAFRAVARSEIYRLDCVLP